MKVSLIRNIDHGLLERRNYYADYAHAPLREYRCLRRGGKGRAGVQDLY